MLSLGNILPGKASYPRKQLEAWLQTLEIAAEAVADVGGRQLPVKDRVKSWQVKQYDIMDLPEHDLNQPWQLNEIYDIVFCLEVSEYLYNPFQAITNLYNMLKKGGVLYTSFHFIYPHHSSKFIDYLRYTRWGIDRLLKEANFVSWQIYPKYFKRPWIIRLFYLSEGVWGNNNNLGKLHTEQGYLVMAQK